MAVLQTAVLAVLVLLCCGTSQGYRHRLFARNSFQSSSALRSSDSDASFIADKIAASCFHHVEFYTGDATSTYKRFLHSLGLELVAKSDFSTGNSVCASYMLQSGQIRMLFTAPYDAGSGYTWSAEEGGAVPMPGYRPHDASEFFVKHGLGVRAVAIEVEDVAAAYSTMLANNAVGVLPPCRVNSQGENGEQGNLGYADFAEVKLYGDVVLRLVNLDHFQGSFLPRFQDLIHVQGQGQELGQKGPVGAGSSSSISGPPSVGRYGIERFDHIVGNVWKMQDTLAYMQGMTGFHEFAEFTAEDVGSVDSGLNSAVLANSNELILLPVNEPTYGTKRKSQIQTYLEQNKECPQY
ncbi:Glyoxalase/Bleomycin resistance protein/Dihydroxybiphenyl dioxygenase [Ochromonadaceae sp. CCMP2298]|nr:Glyoxalase/Bleomycin resistance protein/Dihydroxybiphenyl dioxygenase [Ochromonadaceae sp. CCMP2298]